MQLKHLVQKCRSYRRFDQSHRITPLQLAEWIDLARLAPSGRNQQALKYRIVHTPEECAQLFPTLSWAGYLKEWNGPIEGEQPSAYILILRDNSLTSNLLCDDGLAIQNILLGAVESGFGGCILASVQRETLTQQLAIPKGLDLLYVVALGRPIEEVTIVPIEQNDIRYYRDKKGIHYVPKRTLNELIIE